MSGCSSSADRRYTANPSESSNVNAYENLIGQSFTRHGTRFTVVKCNGATVIAAFMQNQRVHRMMVPLVDVLALLDAAEAMETPSTLARQEYS